MKTIVLTCDICGRDDRKEYEGTKLEITEVQLPVSHTGFNGESPRTRLITAALHLCKDCQDKATVISTINMNEEGNPEFGAKWRAHSMPKMCSDLELCVYKARKIVEQQKGRELLGIASFLNDGLRFVFVDYAENGRVQHIGYRALSYTQLSAYTLIGEIE